MHKKWLIAGITAAFMLATTAPGAAEMAVYAAEAETEASADAAEAQTDAAKDLPAIEFVNVTDWEIVQVAIKNAEAEDYPEEGLLEDEPLVPRERRIFSYEKEAAGDAAEGSALFDVLLTFEGDESRELHGLDFTDMQEAEIHMEMGVPYLIYTSETSGDTVVTFEDEYEAAVTEAGGEAAFYDAYCESPFYEETYYEESWSGDTSSGGAAPAENCLEGGLFY